MTTNTNKPAMSREQMHRAVTTLRASGWEHIATVMADKSTQQDGYGMRFARGEERFWLNVETFTNLPK